MRKPYDFLVISFNLLLKPSTIPAEIVPPARNQLRMSSRFSRKVRATFFIGSILLRIVRVHHSSKNFPAQGPAIAPGVHINLAEAYDTIQKIRAMADILIPIHDSAVGRKKCIPE